MALILSILLLGGAHQMYAAVPCSQDFLRIACIHGLGTAIPFRQEVPSFATPEGELCNLGRNSLVLSCVSKPLGLLQSRQTVHGMPFQRPLVSVHDELDEDKPPKLRAGLLSIIEGNIVIAISFAVSRGRYASRTAQQQRGLFDYQTSQLLLKSLLLGLLATTLLAVLEVSGRKLFVFVECHSFRLVSLKAMVRSMFPLESKTRISPHRKHARVSA